MSEPRGPVREMLEHLKRWAKAFDATIEQAADAFDKVNADAKRSTTDAPPSTLANMTPAKGKH